MTRFFFWLDLIPLLTLGVDAPDLPRTSRVDRFGKYNEFPFDSGLSVSSALGRTVMDREMGPEDRDYVPTGRALHPSPFPTRSSRGLGGRKTSVRVLGVRRPRAPGSPTPLAFDGRGPRRTWEAKPSPFRRGG